MKNNLFQLPSIIFLFILIGNASAQVAPYSLSPDWYFGQGGRLTFPNGNYPTSTAPTIGSIATTIGSVEASTSICHSDGSVAVYTNTSRAYNGASTTNAAFIRDFLPSLGDNTCGGSATGGAVSFPDPANPTNAFYVAIANDLTSGFCPNRGSHRYRFTGTGTGVIYNAGPVQIATDAFAAEGITVGTNGTGGYWLVMHDRSLLNIFRVWQYTAGGISAPVDYNKPDFFSTVDFHSYIKFSPCQDKIAFAGGNALTVYPFDRTTGVIGTEIRRVTGIGHGIGLEFSPDGNRVFYSGQGTLVNYVDISTGTLGNVTGSASWSLQLGPDGKIYTSPGGSALVGVISTPNGTPTYSTLTLPGTATIYRGLINIAWLTPNLPVVNRTITNCLVDFTSLFQNYFNSNIGVNPATILWNFGDGNTSTSASPTHTYAVDGTYNVTLSFNDNTCGHAWTASSSVTVACTLPVDWLSINAVNNSGKATVSWSTSSELNNDYFLVQRSDDGINFTTICKVQGKGNSSSNTQYQFIDASPLEGQNYYRIVQYDTDQSSGTSDIITVIVNDLVFVNVSPNPSNNDFQLQLKGIDDATITVTDVLGREILTNVTAFNNFRFGASLSQGTYVVKINYGNEMYVKKLIKE